MPTQHHLLALRRPRRLATAVMLGCLLVGSACGSGADDDAEERPVLRLSAIPDQDPAELATRERALADYLSEALSVDAEYVPVTDYAASVTLFRSGDLDVVFYGGLTGVQALQQTPGATLLAQRDIDERFQSVFIANTQTGIEPFDGLAGLSRLAGTRFTFGSESSTSGRLMPEYFLREAGVDPGSDFAGESGFSGSHDKTVDLVASGSFETGVLNSQVWDARVDDGTVDLADVVEVYRTDPYHDYHWIAGPDVDSRMGDDFTSRLREALLALDGSDAAEKQVLEGYGATRVVATDEANYAAIREVAVELGLLS